MNYVRFLVAASLFLISDGSFANAEPLLLPSQADPHFYNARMCRDHQVLSALLTAAKGILKTKVTVGGSDGPTTPSDIDDIFFEAVGVLPDDQGAMINCSVTIAAKGITERVVYSVIPTASDSPGNSWMLKFGGDLGKLFPEMIEDGRLLLGLLRPPTPRVKW